MITLAQVNGWLTARETEQIEFKEAKKSFSFDDLVKYTAAIANERGGHIVLGVSPKLPRRVVGSEAFRDLPKVVHGLLQKVGIRVEAHDVPHPDGRVVVFVVPSRPTGAPIEIDGCYLMRAGESLTPMTPDRLRGIIYENAPDFSAEIHDTASPDDLNPAAIQAFRELWQKKSGNQALASLTSSQLLEDAGLLVDGRVTYAALLLLGTTRALSRHLALAEVIFEYRSSELPGPANQRVEFRQGFLSYFDELWQLINLRNDVQHYQEGLLVWDIPTFNERACREAILNAISHRDYRSGASVFVRQYTRRIEIESPGGLPPGVTVENILSKQNPRNRLLAESLARCGFVERSGQGADLMFRLSIKEGKLRPDYSRSDDHWVLLTLHGSVQDPKFVTFLEQVSAQSNLTFGVNDLIVLSLVHEQEPIPESLSGVVRHLLDSGTIERLGRKKLVLSRRFYRLARRPGEYTRRRGLDHETNKELLMKHLDACDAEGSRMKELQQVLPAKSDHQIRRLLHELRSEGRAHKAGKKRGTRWYSGPEAAQAIGSNQDGTERK
jgi:ATP-dependent DNA helicase RecG